MIDRRGSKVAGFEIARLGIREMQERRLFGQPLYTFRHQYADPATGLSDVFTVRTKSIGQHANDKIGDTMLSVIDGEGQRVGVITGKWGEVAPNGKQIFYGLQAHNGISDYAKDIPDPRPFENTWGKFVSRHNALDEYGIETQKDVPGIVGHAIVGLVTALDVIFDSSFLMTGRGDIHERRGRGMYVRIDDKYGDIVLVEQETNPVNNHAKFLVSPR